MIRAQQEGITPETLISERPPEVVIVPLGFICDHMEVIYDLDTVAAGVGCAPVIW